MIRICAFTDRGRRLADQIESKMPEHLFERRGDGENLKLWTKKAFSLRVPIVFIGACGIAVRTIAPYVQDKLWDSPVIVVDEKGEYVIPILSGHMGGGNDLAILLAKCLGAQAVLTTATDVNHLFAIDVFARANGLSICERGGIQRVSAKLLQEGKITMCIAPDIAYEECEVPDEVQILPYESGQSPDVVITNVPQGWKQSGTETQPLILAPKQYVLGIGCKKDTAMENIACLADKILQDPKLNSTYEEVAAIASIDLKARERGLLLFGAWHHIEIKTYTTDELSAVPGKFTESEFVKNVTGVSNVCERAAVCCAGEGAELVVKKVAQDGVTVAVARRKGRIIEWKK